MRPFLRTGLLAIALVAATTATVCVAVSDWWANGNVYERIVIVVLVLGVWALPAASAWLFHWRPAGRQWRLLGALGLVWACWAALQSSADAVRAVLLDPSWLLRPLLFGVILSWPTGRLARGDRTWFFVYCVVQFFVIKGRLLFLDRVDDLDNPIGVFDSLRLDSSIVAFRASVVLPMGAVLLAGSTLRRYRRLPVPARPMARPALTAAVIVTVGELLLVSSDFAPELAWTENVPRAFGGLVLFVNYLPYISTPVLLVIAARRIEAWAAVSPRIREIDVGPGARALPQAVAAALGDPSAVVAYHRRDGAWIDAAGDVVQLGTPGRVATFIDRDGEPIAVVEHDESVDDPTTVELAVAAAGSAIEFERIEAIANARRSDAARARRAIVEAQDEARRRLERDLHDGAQQRLVGLALQVSLAGRDRAVVDPDSVAVELGAGVESTRRELLEVAAGVLPALVAERGLEASIAALAATAPMAVELRISHPAHLEPGVAAAAWFVVSEAVANATKHSGAAHLTIIGVVRDGRLDVRVTDDGRGGATTNAGSGLTGLRERVVRSGGALTVESPRGRGTVVHATFPLAVGP